MLSTGNSSKKTEVEGTLGLPGSTCQACSVSDHCALDNLEVVPPVALESVAGLSRFLKSIRTPEQAEKLSEQLWRQANTVVPKVVSAEESVAQQNVDNDELRTER